jgi:ketosteroid isomerase-like protein
VTGLAQNSKSVSPSPEDRAELERLEQKWNEAHVHGDATALDELWADELVVTVPKMPVMNKAQSMGIWKTGRMKFQKYETSEMVFRVFGDAAVVTGRLIRERNFGDKPMHDDWRFTKVYVRMEGHWRVVSWQSSESAQN